MMPIEPSTVSPALLAEAVSAFLQSPYKPLLALLPFVPWAWLISSRLEKDARYFHLNYQMWNSVYLATGAAALASVLFIPIFWVGWPISILLLIGPVLAYWKLRNAQVPESQQFHLTSESLTSKLEQRKIARAAREALVQFIGPEGERRDVPSREDPLYQVHMLAEDVVVPALEARAAFVEVAVAKTGTAVAQTIDGIRYKREPLSAEQGVHLVDYLKQAAGLDVQDRRRRQTADFRMTGPTGSVTLSLTTAGRSDGVLLRLDFDRANRLSKPFDALGLLPAQRDALSGLMEEHDRHGIVLVGAAPGNGLSTTCYAMVGRHDAYTCNIKTLEREILLRIDGIDHTHWEAGRSEADYATSLQSILRRDPDIVLTGAIEDEESGRVVTDPGMQGPLIYVPVRAATTADVIRAWVKSVGDLKRASRSLRVVTSQRLLRTLCPNCKAPFTPTPEQLKKLGLPAGKVQQLFRANGKVQIKNKIEPCPICAGSGYLGQTAAFEVMVVDSEARKLLAANDLKAALAHARRNKMIYLQEAALSKVAAGETTVEEVVRVTASPKADASSRPAAAAT